MSHTIGDMKSAYVFFNRKRFNGRLPSPYGWGMTLHVGHVDDGIAECDTDSITFSNRYFGNDIRRDLYVLFHEMCHVYTGWEQSDCAHHVAVSSHGGAWAAEMLANDIRLVSDVGHAEVVPGGSFDRLCDEWIEHRGQRVTDTELSAAPFVAAGIAALVLIVIFAG